MKKLASVLAVLAVLAMAGSSLAGITLQVVRDPVNPDPAPGLTGWIVRGVGTEGTLIDTISAISIHDALVHNVWEFSNVGGTPYDNSPNPTFWDPAWEKYDTYRYHHPETVPPADPVPGDYIGRFGDDLVETNDGTDPAGLALPGPPGFEAFAPTVGLGTYGQSNEGTVAFVGIAELDILHVVLYGEGTIALLDIRLLSNGVPTQFENIPIGIPEPSTLILLVLGGLCLVGYRLRK